MQSTIYLVMMHRQCQGFMRNSQFVYSEKPEALTCQHAFCVERQGYSIFEELFSMS